MTNLPIAVPAAAVTLPATARPASLALKLKGWVVAALPFLILAVLWQLIALTQPAYVFPPLGTVFRTIYELGQDGVLLTATLATAQSVGVGAVFSLIIGTLLGFALARYELITAPLLNFTQTVPYVVWALMSLIWFGLNQSAVVFTILVASFPIVSYNVAAGLKNVDLNLLGMAQSVRASRYMILRHIIFPSLTPYLLSASRTMLGMCWKISVLAELFSGGGGGGGVGYRLFAGWEFSRPNEVFAWTVWLVFLMMLSDRAFIVPAEMLATRWKKP